MRFFRVIFLLILFFCLNGYFQTWADEVYLKNGDKVTGKILQNDADRLIIKTDALGTLTIAKQYVDKSLTDEEKQLATLQQQMQEEKVAQRWVKKVSMGYNQTGGNSRTTSDHSEVSLTRKFDSQEVNIKGTADYGSTDHHVSSRRFYELMRYSSSFGVGKRWNRFYKVEGDQDRFANVAYRLTPSVGLGYVISNAENWKWNSDVAVGYEHTKFVANDPKTIQETIIIPHSYFERKLVGSLRMSEDLTLYPSISDVKHYRFRSESKLWHPLSKRVNWTVSFIDDFNSKPGVEINKNDYRFIAGLEYAF